MAIVEIEKIIEQEKFANPYMRLDVNLYYTNSQLTYHRNKLLRPFDISIQQFNILRILRGLKGKPASVKVIQRKMVDKMSNASRMVDKLYAKGLVERVECPNDRRQVEISLTDQGMDVVNRSSEILEANTEQSYSELTAEEVELLNNLLNKIRIS